MANKIEVNFKDSMGSDLTVANSARVSFGKEVETLEANDEELISYLARHKHMSPFGHCFASFHLKAPIFVARQLVKHKFLRWNEVSRRYVDNPPEFYMPEVWRAKATDKKQGSSTEETIEVLRYQGFHEQTTDNAAARLNMHSFDLYRSMIDRGVCPEQARMVLPQSTMTEWWWSGSLDAFSDMCNLRCKDDTQKETREVAEGISTIMEEKFPVSWKELMK